MWRVLGCCCLLLSAHAQAPEEPSDKQFMLNFDSDVYVCPDEESISFIDTSRLQAVRHNETTAILTGFFVFLKDIEQHFVIELLIMKETNGRYEVAATELICDLCDEIVPKDEDNLYSPFLKYIKFPSECPLTAGEYLVEMMMVDTSDFPINASNMGRYECAIRFYSGDASCKERKYLGCIKLDILIEPYED